MKFILSPAWAALALAGGITALPAAATTPTVLSPPAPPVAPAPAPPAVPSRLAAMGQPQSIGSQVQLSWLPVPRALSYKVYRDGQLLATTPGASWTDSAVSPGETHAYAVTSLGAAGESRPSAAVTAIVPAALPKGGNSVIYGDSLVNGWLSWSWAATNFASTSPVRSGKAIRVTAGPWQALYLHHAPFSAAPYAAVTFWINGGSVGGQRLSVWALRSGAAQTAVPLGPLRANQWQSVTVPLSALGVAGAPDMDGLWVADASGTAQSAFSVDDVALTAAPAVTTAPALPPPPAAPAGLSATPKWAASCPKCGGMAMAHIVLAWNAVPSAASYTVYRDGVKVQDGLTTASWIDMDIVSGHSYAYAVTATGTGGEGARSASVSATTPNPPGTILTAPVNLTVTGLWQGAPTDALTWTAVPGAVSYNLYQYDVQIATGLTGTSYTIPTTTFFGGLTYSLTAVGADGTETLPSAVATAQGAYGPSMAPTWLAPPPSAPTLPVARAEWNAGAPRIHLSWNGWDTAYTYNVYRDGHRVAAGLWGLNYYDQDVRPSETHTYTVSGVNVPLNAPVESAVSAAVSVTALSSAPAAAPGPVQITSVQSNDDGVAVSFAAVPGAADYRVYNVASPNIVKYSGGSLSIEMNGLDPVAGADLVVEAVDKLGPFQKMDGMAGPGAMAMDGMHQAINGQGDPSDVPNVLAASAPFHVTCKPFVLTGAQAFADTFRTEQPLTLQPMPAQVNPYYAYGLGGCYWEMANDKWRIRNYVGDVVSTKVFVMGSHFMDTLYDGGTAPSGPMHNNDASLVMMPRQTITLSGGSVLHVTFEVDAHFDSRRWCDLIVAPASDTLLNPGSKAGASRTFSGTDTAFRWRILDTSHEPEMVSATAEADSKTVEFPLLPENGAPWDVALSAARACPYGVPTNPLALSYSKRNGTAQDFDKRHRFDLYLSRTHFRIMEQETVAWEGNIPADQAMPAGPCQVYFVHQLYHTGNDRPEQVDAGAGSAYWYNHRPWCDERHWDNMGQEVLSGFPTLPSP